MDYQHWCSLRDDELAAQDIAEVNLACAIGLPGAEKLHASISLHTLEQWTDRVRQGISNAMRNRGRFPMYDELSDAEYRILTMFSVLYRHVGLTLNLDCHDPNFEYDGGDSSTNFIHSALQANCPLTCCTAPVIFAAIGRRLGYPIKLVKTREHIFCRWVEDNERFNIEATSKGYYRKSDEWYHTFPRPIYREGLTSGVFLTDLTPRQELGLFLSFRGICMLWNLRPAEAIESFYWASKMDPQDFFIRNQWIIATMFEEAQRESTRLHGASGRDPAHWKIPSRCEQFGTQQYLHACRWLDVIRSQRGITQPDFVEQLRFELDRVLSHKADRR